jgi:hypothetical protein
MTRDDIIRMAREAGLFHFYDSEGHCSGITDARLVDEDQERCDDRLFEMLAPFANLVAAAERERIIAQNAPEIEKINEHIKALEEARKAEREACAQVCDEKWIYTASPSEMAEYIRARGNP